MISNYEAWSEDKKYGLRVPSKIVQKMLELCAKSENIETGGIIVGYYNHRRDCAIVVNCSGPPKDSKCGNTYFHRGIQGVQNWIDKLWNLSHRIYYLGEWHFHPFGNPKPSIVDEKQIKDNSENKSYQCPEPIMFILGGNPNEKWICNSFVYVKDSGLIELRRIV